MIAAVALVLVLGGAFIAFRFFFSGVSKDEFIGQADDICQDARDELEAAEEPTDPEEIGALFADAAPVLEAQTRDIRALEAPEEQSDVLEDWLTTQDELARSFHAVAEADADAEAQDQAISELYEVEARSNQFATEYGFEVCGITTPS